jgi:ribose 5-phosphate isomerase B
VAIVRVVIGSDHGGFPVKQELISFVRELGHEVVDFGTHSTEPVDYPDIACLVATSVAREPNGSVGILIDGAGTGSAITANKVPGIRAAACYDTFTAKNSREHNNANVLTLGSRNTGIEILKDITKVWLSTIFQAGRHLRRTEKMQQVERRFMKDA